MIISDHARKLHEKAIIIDAHNDSLILRLLHGESMDIGERHERYHVDVPRALEGGLTCSFFMVGTADPEGIATSLAQAMDLIDGAWALAEKYPDEVLIATSAGDIERAKREGKLSIIGQLESCTCLSERGSTLRNLYRLGVRVANLTHGEAGEGTTQQDNSPFDYCTADDRERARKEMGGLTDFGREIIPEMNRLGVVMDLAHANDATFFEAIELCETPPIFSHGAVFEVCPHWRGLTDDQIRVLAETGGVIGMAAHPWFIDKDAPTMERLVDSIEHVVNLVGPDHIGFGADYDGMSPELTPIPPDVSQLPLLTEALVQRGFDDETVLKVLGGNFLRVLRQVIS